MSNLTLRGNAAGTGTFIVESPNSNTSQTISLPDATGTLATEAYVSSQLIGESQTWQNVTASRALATTYTNSTGKQIQVAVSVVHNASGGASAFLVDGNTIAGFANNMTGTNFVSPYIIIIPDGATYRVNQTSGTAAISTWWELR